ncbi:alpha/beta fold hydrolase [Arthrobacter sp. Z4-13]
MPWLDVLGNDIHYTDAGRGQPVVLLHGHASAAACWEPIVAELEQDLRVLTYDTYDHGWSSNSPRNGPLVDRAAEPEYFINSLGLENPVIVGQFMGGMTALRWAARHPRSLEQSQGEFLSADPLDVDWFQQGLESVKSPLTLLIGDEERPRIRRGAEHVAATVPGARLLVVEDAGHNAYFQRQDILVEAVRNTVASRRGR